MSNNTDNMQGNKPDIFDKIMHLPGLRVFEPLYKKYKEVLLYLFFGVLTTVDRKSTRLNSSHSRKSRMPSSA